MQPTTSPAFSQRPFCVIGSARFFDLLEATGTRSCSVVAACRAARAGVSMILCG
jgi:hypothetical protein